MLGVEAAVGVENFGKVGVGLYPSAPALHALRASTSKTPQTALRQECNGNKGLLRRKFPGV